MASLPADRTKLSIAQANDINGIIADGPKNVNALTESYDTIDLLNQKVDGLVTTTVLSPYPPAQYNKLINGNFDVWQRGTTQITTTSGAYFPDRFSVANSAVNASTTKIDQGSLIPPIGSKYYLRYRLSTASAVIVSVSRFFRYKLESIDVQKLIGNQVTLSFKINSSITRNFSYSLNVFGFTAVDNGINGTGIIAGDADYAQNSVGLTANTWTTVSKTFTMQDPASGTGLAANGISIEIWGRYTTTGAETDTEYQFSQIQLNLGSIALPFQSRIFADELALCQRYYEKSYDIGAAPATSTAAGAVFSIATSATIASGFRFKTVKRISAPTVTIYSPSGTSGKVWSSVDADISSGVGTGNPGDSGVRYINASGAGLTANTNITFHYTCDAEL